MQRRWGKPPVPPPLHAVGISKAFAGVQALRGVDLDVARGEIHALVGENGAGKSTRQRSQRRLRRRRGPTLDRGDRLHGDPRAHAGAGIAMVYQEPRLVPGLSAADNVFLGHPFRRGPFIARRVAARRLGEIAASVGIDLEPNARAGDLTLAKQRMIDVIRALDSHAKVLIMDEPSAALGPVEQRASIGRLRAFRTSRSRSSSSRTTWTRCSGSRTESA